METSRSDIEPYYSIPIDIHEHRTIIRLSWRENIIGSALFVIAQLLSQEQYIFNSEKAI